MNIYTIRNLKRQTGFDHVQYSAPKNRRCAKPYQAVVYGGKLDKAGRKWKGPRRATAEESAQDYCDYVAGAHPTTLTPKLISAGHPSIKVDRQVSDKRSEAYRLLKEASEEEATVLTGYIYCISDGTAMKLGMSVGHPQNRLKSLQTGNPRKLELLAFKEVPNRVEAEIAMHLKYIDRNILGEWFKYDKVILKEFV